MAARGRLVRLHPSPPFHPAHTTCPSELLRRVEECPPDRRDDYEEQAAIMIFDGGHVWCTAVRFAYIEGLASIGELVSFGC